MLSVANKPIMLSVIMLNAVMLSVVAPYHFGAGAMTIGQKSMQQKHCIQLAGKARSLP
jgi:hypothetical protein